MIGEAGFQRGEGMPASHRARLMVVVGAFPSLSETFLYTMLKDLQCSGVQVLVRARHRGTSPHQTAWCRNVRYLPSEELALPLRMAILLPVAAWVMLRRPATFVRAVRVLRRHTCGLRELVDQAYLIAPLLVASADAVYFAMGNMAAKYALYTMIRPNAIVALIGSDAHTHPLLSDTYRERLKLALLNAAAVRCVCEDTKRRAERLVGGSLPNAVVVPIAVDAAHLSGPDPSRVVRRPAQGEVRLVSTGRLHWCKGLEHGMMALRELLNRGVACRWRIVGEGPYRAALECAVRDLGLGDVVSLVGARDAAGIREELLSADVMFHPTVADAISNSVLEGMALGLPVVAGDAGGIREGVRHGETGLLIPPRDWRAMADALEVLARNPDLRARMGAAGREAVLCRFTPRHQDKAMAALLAMVGGTR